MVALIKAGHYARTVLTLHTAMSAPGAMLRLMAMRLLVHELYVWPVGLHSLRKRLSNKKIYRTSRRHGSIQPELVHTMSCPTATKIE